MKCLCDHKHSADFIDGEIVEQGTPFVRLEKVYPARYKGMGEYKDLVIYACPVCGTLKVDPDDLAR